MIDDGTRTLILDPQGFIQINLSLIRTNGSGLEPVLDAKQQEAEQSHPNPMFLRFEKDGITTIHVRGIQIDEEPVDQAHHLIPWSENSHCVRARITADPESINYAMAYAALILNSANFFTPQPTPGVPAWYQKAQQLESEDRLEEAENLLKDRIPNIHCAIAIAGLYRERWQRLLPTDPIAAAKARKEAAAWADYYASSATSGGEGVALSHERDKFIETLGPEPFDK